MTKFIDISRDLVPDLPVWPGSPGFRSFVHSAIASGDVANGTGVEMDVHAGTHVDAPRHFVEGGATVDQVGLGPFIGPAVLADVPDVSAIGAEHLAAAEIPTGTQRLLLRTRNSESAECASGPFQKDFAALSPDGARWVVERRLTLIGIDYLSIQRFHDPPDVHHILLNAGVSILEGLDLRAVRPGAYNLVCLPLRLIGAEASPARAILFSEVAS